jgi:hypothetical protein
MLTQFRPCSKYKKKHISYVNNLYKDNKINLKEKTKYIKKINSFKGSLVNLDILYKNILRQAYVGKGYELFKNDFMKKYKFCNYTNINNPCIFYGIGKDSIIKIKKHIGPKVIVFCGSDILHHMNKLKTLKNLKNVYFLSISIFIFNILQKYGINSRRLHLSPTLKNNLNLYTPVKKGNSIFIYTGLGSRKDIYGFPIWKKLILKFPDINFIVTTNPICYKMHKNHTTIKITDNINIKVITFNNYDDLLNNAYKKCFLGLRLTTNDGNSAIVNELGLLGIKSVHNGYQPCAINYKSFEDIVDIINRERKTIGTIDYNIHKQMINFNYVGYNWLNINYYK